MGYLPRLGSPLTGQPVSELFLKTRSSPKTTLSRPYQCCMEALMSTVGELAASATMQEYHSPTMSMRYFEPGMPEPYECAKNPYLVQVKGTRATFGAPADRARRSPLRWKALNLPIWGESRLTKLRLSLGFLRVQAFARPGLARWADKRF
jgi:hypothetical protein